MKCTEITVAICVYNAERYIAETLSCITAQTMQDFHLLIVNDCSTDTSLTIIESFLKKNSRQCQIVNFPTNQGLAFVRHYVENHVETKYILFIDADDRPYSNLVEKLYNKINSDPDLIAVGCYHEFIDSRGYKIGGGVFIGEKNKEDFYVKSANKKMIFMQPTAIVTREALLSVGGRNITGFPEGKPRYQDLCEDLDLWTRMSDLYIEGKAIVVIPEVLCQYRKHEQGLSSNTLGMILRMKHIKTNLLHRRSNQEELTFIEFFDSLSPQTRKQLNRDAIVADSLRNGVFYLKKGRVFTGSYLVLKSFVLRPSYLWQKIRSNSGLFR